MTEKMIQFNARRTESQDDILHYLCVEEGLGRCEMDRLVFNDSPRVIELRRRLRDESGFPRVFRKQVLVSKR